jgi:predicted MFS family arabinose efflux permease
MTPKSTGHNFRYLIFLMIVVITMLNYIDRGAIAYAAEAITHEYGFGRVAWGAVLGYFGYGYMFGALLGGTFADVWGPEASVRDRWFRLVVLRSGIGICGRSRARAIWRFSTRWFCGHTGSVRVRGRARVFDHQQDDVAVGSTAGTRILSVSRVAWHTAWRAADSPGIRWPAVVDQQLAGDVSATSRDQRRGISSLSLLFHGSPV